jgi:hypothetical protein
VAFATDSTAPSPRSRIMLRTRTGMGKKLLRRRA